MKVIPVNFGTEHKQLLSHLHVMVTKWYLAIPEKYDKLITSLRTAYAKELTLDKELTSYNDSLDALRLSLKGYNIEWENLLKAGIVKTLQLCPLTLDIKVNLMDV